jgi:hypothetical protein
VGHREVAKLALIHGICIRTGDDCATVVLMNGYDLGCYGSWVGHREVAKLALIHGINIRTGWVAALLQ